MKRDDLMKMQIEQDERQQFGGRPIRHKAGDEFARPTRSIPYSPPSDARVAHPDIRGSKP